MITDIDFQIMWNRLISVVEEQAQTLIRTAFGTSTREAGDLSAGVYDRRGQMIAQAVTGTPGHVNSMARTVGHVLAKFPAETMKEGDVFITNDPWMGTGHLNDIVVVTPAHLEGRLIGFFACTLHVVDIGGAGSSRSFQVYEEGIRIPIVRLVEAGTFSETLLDTIRANVREPVEVLGDIRSEVAANAVACRRLARMMREFGLADLEALSDYILTRSKQAILTRIRALPRGTFENWMTTDGITGPITLKARVTVGEDGLDVEYFDCPPVVELGFNVPYCYTDAYTCFGLHCVVAADVPNNAGSLSAIRVHVPENTMLNAPDPLPVTSRALMGQLLPDLMLGCLAQIVPEKVMAEGSARLWSVGIAGGLGRVKADPALLAGSRRFEVSVFQSGGMGARFAQDGLSATAFPSGVRNISVELTETYAPVVFRRKEYRQDSGGPGRSRGGLGQSVEIAGTSALPFAVSTSFDRIQFPARGRAGGHAGARGYLGKSTGEVLPGKGYHQIDAGESIVIEIPGGGGYHDPRTRDPALVARDVRNGLVSAEQARAAYGVALTAEGAVDAEATRALRAGAGAT